MTHTPATTLPPLTPSRAACSRAPRSPPAPRSRSPCPLAGSAQAATPSVNLSALQSALDALPGVNAGQVQALVGDLGLGRQRRLADDARDRPRQHPRHDRRPTPATRSCWARSRTRSTICSTARRRPPTSTRSSTSSRRVANQSGVPATVDNAVDELVDGLTGADLEQILGQAGSPLSAQQVQEIVGELDTLEGLAPGATVPSGALSALASGLDTIASQPGVPAAVASTLEDVAGTLDSGPLSPSTLASIVPALDSAVPSLDSVPISGPALGSLVGSLGTELGASPAGASGGAGGAGGSGGSGAGTTAAGSSAAGGSSAATRAPRSARRSARSPTAAASSTSR